MSRAEIQHVYGDVLADFMPTHATANITKHVALQFESVAALYAKADGFDPKTAWDSQGWNGPDRWVGCTQEQANSMARKGWPEGAARIARLRDKLSADRPSGPRIVRWDVAGALPSVPRALSGNPLSMRRVTVATTPRQPVVTLLQDISAASDVDADAFQASTVAASAIVDALEAAGFRVEIIGAFRSRTGRFLGDVAVRLKEAGDPLNLNTLAFTLGHSGFFRAWCFRVMGGTREAEDWGPNLGRPIAFDPERAPPGVYVMPGPNQIRDADPAVAMDKMIAALRAQGCPGIPAEDADGA